MIGVALVAGVLVLAFLLAALDEWRTR